MRRKGGHWPLITRFDHLCASAWRAARGKRQTATVARFLERLEPEVLQLKRELETQSWRPQPPTRFRILDPKERTITAAAFRDRVVHHALIDAIEPALERRMVACSFACRKGMGTHRALDHARRLVRRFGWFLKLDVRKCFDSLRHDVVLAAARRVIKGRATLALIETIVRHDASAVAEGRGLPIGSLTSQWLANLVLDQLDHFALEQLRVPGYVRYMDDFALFGGSKGELWRWHAAVERFLRERLGLELKSQATCLAPTTEGLPFLGWRIHPGTTRLKPESRRRLLQRHRRLTRSLQHGGMTEEQFAVRARSLFVHASAGSTLAWRRLVSTREPMPRT